ncbi:MAG: DUF2225 domain-containing protein [Syntrophomonas sp.]
MIDVNKLAQKGTLRRYIPDEVFFTEGDSGHEMFILLKGKAEVSLKSADGFSLPVNTLETGDFFGEMSLLENMPRNATVQALDECLVIAINEDNFEQIISEQPSLAFRIMKGMSKRQRQLNEEISQLKKADNNKASEPKPEHHPLSIEDENEPTVNASLEPDSNLLSDNLPADDNLPLLDSSLFPPLHKHYSIIAPATDEDYLFDKEANCPVCGKSFSVKMMRSSKLKLQCVDPDMRQRFVNFNPLWYIMWVCPHCYYANFHFDFKQVSEVTKKHVNEQYTQLKEKINPYFSSPRNLNEVFTAYYLALNNLKTSKPDSARIANVWLRLSWLYNDAEDQEMFDYASTCALDNFQESYYGSQRNASLEQDQKLTLLMGELSLRTGKAEEALKHFRSSIVRKGGSSIINRQAEDRIQDLKTMINN